MKALGRALRAFAAFWVDFLVGDSPEIFLGVLVVVAAALLFRHHRVVAIPLVLGCAIVLLIESTYRGRIRKVDGSPHSE